MDESLFVTGSLLVVVTAAVLEMLEPFGTLGPTLTTSVNVADVLVGNDRRVQATVPDPPGDGVAQEKDGPAVCENETNVVLAGTASVSAISVASKVVSLFVTMIL